MELRKCLKCNSSFPDTEEYFYRSSKGYLTSPCKKCRKKSISNYKKATNYKSDREWQNRNRAYFKDYMNGLNDKIREKLGIGYVGIHKYIRENKKKPQYCVICNEEKDLELHCFDHDYCRDLTKWIYVCKECHSKLNTLIRTYAKV